MRMWFVLIILLLTTISNAAVITRYVNTASSGGDGTTNATAGANAAYASLFAWEAAEETNLVSATDTHVVHCEGTAADTATVSVSGWTTSETYFITIQVDADKRHDGKWDETAYRLDFTDAATPVNFNEDVKVVGLQIRNTLTDTLRNTVSYSGGYDVIDMSYCIIMAEGDSAGFLFNMTPYSLNGKTYRFYNNVFYVGNTDSLPFRACFFIDTSANTTDFSILMYNNTFIGGNDNCINILDVNAIVTAKNNIVANSVTENVFIATESGSDYNASDSASNFDSGGGHNRDSQTFTFVDAGNQDFHLDGADAGARTYGVTDPGSGLFDDDIDGETRTPPWDIGADQVSVAAAGHASPLIGGPRLKSKFRGLIR